MVADLAAHLLRPNLRYRATSNNRLTELGKYEPATLTERSEVSSARRVKPSPSLNTTHPTILSQVLLTYFFCSTPSLTTSTTVLTSLVKSPTYALSALTNSASFHGLRSIAAKETSIVSSNSRRMARRAAEMVCVKSSFSASSVTRDRRSGWMAVWRRSSSYAQGSGRQQERRRRVCRWTHLRSRLQAIFRRVEHEAGRLQLMHVRSALP